MVLWVRCQTGQEFAIRLNCCRSHLMTVDGGMVMLFSWLRWAYVSLLLGSEHSARAVATVEATEATASVKFWPR